jgi:hypothetical protein
MRECQSIAREHYNGETTYAKRRKEEVYEIYERRRREETRKKKKKVRFPARATRLGPGQGIFCSIQPTVILTDHQ